MLFSLTHYLASQPPGQTTMTMVLGALTPGFLMVLDGFAWAHAADVREGR